MTTAPYDHEALWFKAKLFVNLAMDEDSTRTFDERALWASLALELLARSALSRTSPLLVAEPTEDGTNLLIASGLVDGDARFASLRSRTVFSRCARAFKPFSEREAMMVANARNDYVHGPSARFASIAEDSWWTRYWAQAAILVDAQELTITDLVGPSRSAGVEDHLVRNADNIRRRAEALLSRARQRLAQRDAGLLPARIAARWEIESLVAGLRHSASETCPACATPGTIEGNETLDVQVTSEPILGGEFASAVTLVVASDYFSCARCHLVLDGPELIDQAGLPLAFATDGRWDDVEPDDGFGTD